MKILGFNFTKIHAEKTPKLKSSGIVSNIEFLDIVPEKLDALNNLDVLEVSFKHTIHYKETKDKASKNVAEFNFEGNIVISTDKEETKEIEKSWKKKQISPDLKVSLLNLIIKRCSIKALSLEDELGVPLHIPLPKLSVQNQPSK